jgi:hypothetical protein
MDGSTVVIEIIDHTAKAMMVARLPADIFKKMIDAVFRKDPKTELH